MHCIISIVNNVNKVTVVIFSVFFVYFCMVNNYTKYVNIFSMHNMFFFSFTFYGKVVHNRDHNILKHTSLVLVAGILIASVSFDKGKEK